MIKETLMNFNQPWMPTFVTVLFVVLFVAMLVWINRRGSNSYYTKAGHMPLEEGVKSER